MSRKILTAKGLADIQNLPITNNLISVHEALIEYGEAAGLNHAHRLVPYLANLGHESLDYRYDREIWGPTAAQKRYEGRKDLGNIYPGDGSKFRGYGPSQITGRFNTTAFYEWCVQNIDRNCPDFRKNPELICTDPWEGLSAIWYWSNRKINRAADVGDLDKITRLINGGYNGHADRLDRYTEIGLNLLGYEKGPSGIRLFQERNKLSADGISGPVTRARIHTRLLSAPLLEFSRVPKSGVIPKPKSLLTMLINFLKSLQKGV